MSDERLAELKKLDEEAVQGPWEWFGNTDTEEVYLSTINRGRLFIMGFERWGTQGAKPLFRDSASENAHMEGVEIFAQFEKEYRRDFIGLDQPDACMVAQGRQGFHELIEEVERLRQEVKDTLKEMNHWYGVAQSLDKD